MELARPPRIPDDAYVNDGLHKLLKSRVDDQKHMTSALSLYIRRMHLAKMLSLYEAFKMVSDLPGSIVELGVFKGESLLFFAKLMEIFNVNDRSCSVIGFDNFHGFEQLHEKDGKPDERTGKVPGGWSSAGHYDELKALINLFDHDRMVPQKPRINLVEGDICKTVPEYVKENPGLRIRLLNIDCDMYEPTLVTLQHLYPQVVSGGVVLIDEYGFTEFPGESRAVEEYFGGKMPVIRKFPLNSNPGGYFIKP
jgi:hypothetical protein